MYHTSAENAPVIFLMGPTASGKTALALRLARRFPIEIVNADSVQIYRGMEIGSAKPTPDQRRQVPHHLLDVTDPDLPWSADRYREAAWETIRGCHDRGISPLFVGGSGLYLRAVEQGLALTPPVPESITGAIRAEAGQQGWPHLHRRLATVDPAAAGRITPGDGQRILRALSVFEATRVPLSEWCRRQPLPPPFAILKLAIGPPRPLLYQRIEARYDRMIQEGLLPEAQALLDRGYDLNLPAMKAVGYRQLFPHLQGKESLERALDQAKCASRRYAKRQETWLKQEPDLIRLADDAPEREAAERINRFLTGG
ncbi:MAG: tRNA (adenosine(37)-N6)-dimethylallyltransferase MiaA [Magnetococcales bacterium]|nr:tRNA (adenosine(37)-N6)-dimethylallyltransferase MiaA [Magnetococcales bacterium]